jgi:hypothetical protein
MSRGGPPRRRIACAALAAAGLLATALSAADFLDSYREGLSAIERGDWSAAAELMRQAVAGRAEEDPRLARRFYLKRYTPHFYLGQALFELGDCAGALAAWAESERQGVIQRFDDGKQIAAGRATCRERQAAAAAAEEAVRRTRDQIGRAAAAQRTLAELRRAPELEAAWNEGSPSPAARLAEAGRILDDARQHLPAANAPIDLARVVEAGDLAAEALRRLEALEREAERLAAVAQADRQASRGKLDELVANAASLLEATAFLEPAPPEVARRRREVQELAGVAGALPATAPAPEIERLHGDLAAALGRLRRATQPPPEALAAAAGAFFAGDYERAETLLSGLDSGEARLRAHAALLRAATRLALYLVGGEADAALLAEARQDVEACRRADPNCSPLPGAFSPRFVEFFTAEAGSRSSDR